MYDLLIRFLTNECNTHIPKKRTHPKNTNHIWINENLKQLVRQKKNLRYTNCASGWKNPDMIRKYNEVCKITGKPCFAEIHFADTPKLVLGFISPN